MNRSRIILAAASMLVGAGAASADDFFVAERSLDRLGYFKYWDIALELSRGGQVVAAHLVDDTLYVVTDKGDMHAVHAGVGLPRWSQHLAESVYHVFTPSHFAYHNGKALGVYTTSRRTIIADRYSGEFVADMPLEQAMAGTTIASGDFLFFGGNDGYFYCMIWSDPRTPSPIMSWKVMTGGPVTATPVFVNEGQDIVFASQNGVVYNATALQRILNWSFKTGGPVTGDIHVDPDSVYVASTDRSLYRVDTTSGVQRWRLRFQDPLREGPTVVAQTVYQYSAREGLAAVSADNGKVLWKSPAARSLVCSNEGRICVASVSDELQVLDSATGDILATERLQRAVVTVRNTRDNSMYLVSAHGTILCARPEGASHLTPNQVAEARRTLHAQPARTAADERLPDPPRAAPEESVIDLKDPLRSRSRTPALGSDR